MSEKPVSSSKGILGFAMPLVLLGLVLLVALAIAINAGFSSQPKPPQLVPQSPSPTFATPAITQTVPTATWKTYTNPDFQFSVKYPSSWVYCNENDGASFGPLESPPCPRPPQTGAEPPITVHVSKDGRYAQSYSAEFAQNFDEYERKPIDLDGLAGTRIMGRERIPDRRFALLVVKHSGLYFTLITFGDNYITTFEGMYPTLRIAP